MPKKSTPESKRHKRIRRGKASADDVEESVVWPHQVKGGKHVRSLQALLQDLRESDPHPNRELFLDDVFVMHLLAFFNPSIRSLRTFEDSSKTRQVQRLLSKDGRISRSTLSDFHQFADVSRLTPIINHLRSLIDERYAGKQLPKDLQQLSQEILAVDGTFFNAAADIAWAVGYRNQTTTKHKARLDVHVNVSTWLPEVIAIPKPGEGEAEHASHEVKAGCIHLYDRGYNSFALLQAHYEPKNDELVPLADFVIRAKLNQPIFEPIETRDCTDQEQVVSDRLGKLPGLKTEVGPPIVMREVVLRSPEENGGVIRILTSLLDVSAETIGLLYRYRWQVELFFRWLKAYACFDHLISHSARGAQLQFYVVMVGVLLMYLHTGGRPSKYAVAMLQLVASGAATLEEVIPILRERERACQLERERKARKRAEKKQASK